MFVREDLNVSEYLHNGWAPFVDSFKCRIYKENERVYYYFVLKNTTLSRLTGGKENHLVKLPENWRPRTNRACVGLTNFNPANEVYSCQVNILSSGEICLQAFNPAWNSTSFICISGDFEINH